MAVSKLPKGGKDSFANFAYLAVDESGTDTLTFAQLALANNLMTDKVAIIIHAAEYALTNPAVLNSTTDYTDIALTVSNTVTALYDLSMPEILFYARLQRIDIGTAASGFFVDFPKKLDFTNLPGGGILVPADRLYVGVKSTGASGVNGVKMRLYYTVMQLATEDYWQLIEARRIMRT